MWSPENKFEFKIIVCKLKSNICTQILHQARKEKLVVTTISVNYAVYYKLVNCILNLYIAYMLLNYHSINVYRKVGTKYTFFPDQQFGINSTHENGTPFLALDFTVSMQLAAFH